MKSTLTTWVWLTIASITVMRSSAAEDVVLPISGVVTIQYFGAHTTSKVSSLSLSSPSFSNWLAEGPCVPTAAPFNAFPLIRSAESLPGCEMTLDADPSVPGVQPFTAGTVFSFSLFVASDPPSASHSWSSNPISNSDAFDHVRLTYDFQFGAAVRMDWEAEVSGGDSDFNDFCAYLYIDGYDIDGDGLKNNWETSGIDADGDGSVELNLAALGANPYKKDVFLYIDYMDCAVTGGDCPPGQEHSHLPKASALAALVDRFAEAPVLPAFPELDTPGVNLHVSLGNAIRHFELMSFATNPGYAQFADLKADNAFITTFPQTAVFHYCIMGHRCGNIGGQGELFGNDYFVTQGGYRHDATSVFDDDGDGLDDARVGTAQNQMAALMHELGHNLGLQHGGNDELNYKPNYKSVMNYGYAYHLQGTSDPDGPGPLVHRLDFGSSGVVPVLHESALMEDQGVAGPGYAKYFCPDGSVRWDAPGPFGMDWNCDGAISHEALPPTNINRDWVDTNMDGVFDDEPGSNEHVYSDLASFNDWGNLKFDFNRSGAINTHNGALAAPEPGPEALLTPPQADAGSIADGDFATPPGLPHEPYGAFLGQTIQLDGSGSVDIDAPLVSYEWDFPFGVRVDAVGPLVEFACDAFVGEGVVFLTVQDTDGQRSIDAGSVVVDLDAGRDQSVECTGANGTTVTLGGTLPANTHLSYVWSDLSGAIVGSTGSLETSLPLGAHTLFLTVTDSRGVSDTDSVAVIVRDTQAPEISALATTTSILWPPNHQFVNVGATATVADLCDSVPTITVLVYSDEPEGSHASGSVAPDASNLALGALRLRAERAGIGNGRVYLVLVVAIDGSGNTSRACTSVVVPRAHSLGAIAAVLAEAAEAEAYCEASGVPPPGYFAMGGSSPVHAPRSKE